MYKIELSNGNVISGVSINGGLCSTRQEIDASTFSGGLARVRFSKTSNDEGDELCMIEQGEYERMKLEYVYPDRWEKGTYKFLLVIPSSEEIEKMRLEARISYLEMLAEDEE